MSYVNQASAGMLWLTIGTVVAKASSFLSLIVLGWYLSMEEFALYALAYSGSSVFIALRNGGIQQILIQRGAHSYNIAVNSYTRYAIFFNFLAMMFIFMASPLIVNLYNDDILYILLGLIAISLPMGTAGLFYRSKLAIDLRFSDVARFDAYSSIVRHASAAILAVSGFGVISCVLPLIFVALFEGLYGKYKSRVNLLKRKSLSLFTFKHILNSSRWIIITSIATSLVLQGDYFVIGLFENKETVGLYFFGFQVTLAIGVVIARSIQSVLLPVMSKMKKDKQRQSEAYKKMLIVMMLIVTPLFFLMYLLSDYIINIIWGGKWDDAIPVIQLMSLSLITIVLIPIGKSILESHARWKTVSYLMIFDAIGTILSAVIGSLIGGLLTIAASVSVFRFCFGFAYTLYVAGQLKMAYTFIIKLIIFTVISGILALVIVRYIEGLIYIQSVWLTMFYEISVFIIAYLFMLIIFQYKNYNITKKYLYSLVPR